MRIFLLGVLVIFLQGCQNTNDFDNVTPTALVADQSNTQITAPEGETRETDLEPQQETDLNSLFFQENSEGFRMEEISPPNGQEESLTNTTESLRAFTYCAEFCGIFVEEISTGRIYELKAPSFIRGRPFSNLTWVQDKVLAFDQSTQPHQRIHYIVDIEKQELINAYPYPIE